MQNLKPNLTQKIVNLCNSQKNFTYNLSKKPLDYYNYIVSEFFLFSPAYL